MRILFILLCWCIALTLSAPNPTNIQEGLLLEDRSEQYPALNPLNPPPRPAGGPGFDYRTYLDIQTDIVYRNGRLFSPLRFRDRSPPPFLPIPELF